MALAVVAIISNTCCQGVDSAVFHAATAVQMISSSKQAD
jgi:hypothetical protein